MWPSSSDIKIGIYGYFFPAPPAFRKRAHLRGEVEVVERDEVPLQQPHEQGEVDAVGELGLQVVDVQVDLAQVLVGEGHQGLLHHLQLVRGVVEQGVERVALLETRCQKTFISCSFVTSKNKNKLCSMTCGGELKSNKK